MWLTLRASHACRRITARLRVKFGTASAASLRHHSYFHPRQSARPVSASLVMERPWYRLNAGHHRRFRTVYRHTMLLTLGVKACQLSATVKWAILPQTLRRSRQPRRPGSLSPCFTAGAAAVCAGRYQHRSLSRAGETPRPPQYCSSKARCVTGWLVWQSDGNRTEGTAKFLPSGGAPLAFIASGYEHPSRI